MHGNGSYFGTVISVQYSWAVAVLLYRMFYAIDTQLRSLETITSVSVIDISEDQQIKLTFLLYSLHFYVPTVTYTVFSTLVVR